MRRSPTTVTAAQQKEAQMDHTAPYHVRWLQPLIFNWEVKDI